ncbi:MAG TPA: hypothetical protein VG692_17765 [Gemmatimonadales bacterium]|nr:hypothetical protein [Gemmatimonadales bacterium]
MTFTPYLLAVSLAFGGPGGPGDPAPVSSAGWLRALPDGPTKRQFVLDCTGCHQFDAQVTTPNGSARTREQWIEAVKRMLTYGGATTSFPVIGAGRAPEATAEWLTSALARSGAPSSPRFDAPTVAAEVREYLMPVAQDLPHDVAVEPNGSIVITGMFSHTMYRLDPASGTMTAVPLPVEKGGPRAVEVDREGNWWVLMGAAQLLGRYAPSDGKWTTWPLATYPHSVALDSSGGAWYNGHFTRDPEQLTRIDPATGGGRTFSLPLHPTMAKVPGGPVPYEIRTGPDGRIWGSELQGNRIYALTPSTGAVEVYPLPREKSGPRRLDVGPDGTVWVPGYADNSLLRFDPATRVFTTYPLPVPDALPYVARVDPSGRRVWIGTGAADALIAFDIASGAFTIYPLPTHGAMVRHMAFDPGNGDLWLAYGASPGRIPARVARVRVR